MNSPYSVTVNEVNRDRFARETKIDTKFGQIFTPHFAPLLRAADEMDLFLRMRVQYPMRRVRACVVRLFDAPTFLLPRLAEKQQTTIDGSILFSEFRDFVDKTLLFVEPATEYLYYEHNLPKFQSSRAIPEPLRDYAQKCASKKEKLSSDEYGKWKSAYHRLFWSRVRSEPKLRGQLIGETLDLELKCRGKATLAPVPIVDSKETLATAIEMNRVTHELAQIRDAENATYLILHMNSLGNEPLMEEVKEFIAKSRSPLTILKFKYLDLTDSKRIAEREAYGDLLQELAYLREKVPSRGFMLLEGENQTFASALVGFDLVSTSYSGQDGDGGSGSTPYGKWYDPKEMMQRDFVQTQRIFKASHALPHGCPVCRSIVNLRSVTVDEWYAWRRFHYCFCMQEYMDMIGRAINEKHVELARDMIVNSSISVLKNLIPRS